jgi:hypothetical protein
LVDIILSRYEDNVEAVLFYGSCLRNNVFVDNVADFYVIVKDLNFNKNIFIRLLNHLFPPNVYYLETTHGGDILRAKYGIFSFDQFRDMASMNAFHPYLWARLVQPMKLVYVKDDAVKNKIVRSIYTAILTLTTNVIPLIKDPFDLQEFWLKAFSLTYKTEIRPEGKKNIVNIYNTNKEYLTCLAENILDKLPYPIEKFSTQSNSYSYSIKIRKLIKFLHLIKWCLRIVYGKILSVMRLLKSLFTFNNAFEYGFYKLSKHTPNVKIPSLFKDNLFLSCMYLFIVGIKRKIF